MISTNQVEPMVMNNSDLTGKIVGNFILTKRIETIEELITVLKAKKSIFWNFKVLPTAFFWAWQLRQLLFGVQNKRFYDIEPKDKVKFDITRYDLYEYDKPRERTRKRLLEMALLGMEELGVASFGINDVMGGLYIERVWNDSDSDFNDYMDWVKSLIEKNAK